MTMNLSGSRLPREIFKAVETSLKRQNLEPQADDLERPWGGFFTFGEERARDFLAVFFPELSHEILRRNARLSPKILMVGPRKQLSWQYHHRRAEIWKCLHGGVGLFVSATDLPGPRMTLSKDQTIEIPQGQRHRLVGLETWGIIAEIWMHTDPDAPSDENDIVRLEDDFGR